MDKHLLITISDDVSCLYGARFTGSFFQCKPEMKITLLYVAAAVDPVGGASGQPRSALDRKMAESARKKGHHALETAKKLLADGGFASERIECKFMHKRLGTVKDIIKEGRAGLYDAVVLGRRGYVLFESLLASSVSKEILARDVDFPLWICRRPEEHRKNVLLAVDGSEPSLRMADHVGFMLKDETDHAVTVLHVDTGHGKHVDAIVEQARGKLLENGVGPDRIRTLVARSSKVVRSILDEAEKQSYAVLAVGRAGVHKGSLNGWLVGSTSMKLVEELDKAVLWVSR